MKEYIINAEHRPSVGRLRRGDWVVYDCYDGGYTASIGQVIDFEPNEDRPDYSCMLLMAPDHPKARIVRRCCHDLKVGLMRKITNPNTF